MSSREYSIVIFDHIRISNIIFFSLLFPIFYFLFSIFYFLGGKWETWILRCDANYVNDRTWHTAPLTFAGVYLTWILNRAVKSEPHHVPLVVIFIKIIVIIVVVIVFGAALVDWWRWRIGHVDSCDHLCVSSWNQSIGRFWRSFMDVASLWLSSSVDTKQINKEVGQWLINGDTAIDHKIGKSRRKNVATEDMGEDMMDTSAWSDTRLNVDVLRFIGRPFRTLLIASHLLQQGRKEREIPLPLLLTSSTTLYHLWKMWSDCNERLFPIQRQLHGHSFHWWHNVLQSTGRGGGGPRNKNLWKAEKIGARNPQQLQRTRQMQLCLNESHQSMYNGTSTQYRGGHLWIVLGSWWWGFSCRLGSKQGYAKIQSTTGQLYSNVKPLMNQSIW